MKSLGSQVVANQVNLHSCYVSRNKGQGTGHGILQSFYAIRSTSDQTNANKCGALKFGWHHAMPSLGQDNRVKHSAKLYNVAVLRAR